MADYPSVQIGATAPELLLGHLPDRALSLADFRGKQHVLLYFMNSFS